MYIADGDYIKDIEVNDLRNRYTLTKGATQKMVKLDSPWGPVFDWHPPIPTFCVFRLLAVFSLIRSPDAVVLNVETKALHIAPYRVLPLTLISVL